MLPKNLRLDPKEIPLIAKKGRKSDGQFFYLKSWFDDSLANSKFAISISVKVDKRAVIRNRIKRKLRAVIVELVSENPSFRKGKYLIIIKSKDLKDLANSEIEAQLKSMLQL